jgi:thiamine-phosphate pyrophosphorylase
MSIEDLSTLRILDAAANRATEGLRVVEDYFRFALDDAHLTNLCKQLRHDLAEALRCISSLQRHCARDTNADVGTSIVTQAFAVAIEQLRYRTYTLERAADLTRASAERLAEARLYVLIDGRSSLDEFASLAQSLVDAGVDLLQLRDKRLTDRELVGRADRPDIARVADADGVHVGQEELSVKDARTIVGLRALVGVSTHSIEQARDAVLDGANYIGVGPTFRSTTKDFDSLAGLDLLRAVAAEIRLPAFAIGGISLENVGEVLATSITRVAVSAAIVDAINPTDAARQLIRPLKADL